MDKGCKSFECGLSLFISNSYSCSLNQFFKSFTHFHNIPNVILPSECDEIDWIHIVYGIINHLNATDIILIYDESASKKNSK